MKAYKIYSQDKMGFEFRIIYAYKYNKAIELFNNRVREELKDVSEDLINKIDFSNEVKEFRKWNKGANLLCRKYPLLIYKPNSGDKLIATIPYWSKTNNDCYQYNDYEVLGDLTVLEEIELIE